jgi:vancomycin permeability regulator SanA
MRRRVEGALLSARSSQNPRFLVTGGVGRFAPSEARVMQKLLTENGVREENILLEEEATDTLSSVRYCTGIIRRILGIQSIVVCTDRYHMLRTRWLFYLYGIHTRTGQVASGRKQTGFANGSTTAFENSLRRFKTRSSPLPFVKLRPELFRTTSQKRDVEHPAPLYR